NKAVHIVTTLAFVAAATFVSYRGITATKSLQYALVGLQLLVITVFAAMAVTKADEVAGSLSFSWTWMNPFAVESFAAFTAGLSLSIFIYWGWDTCLSVNEESVGSARTPGRAALLAIVVIVSSYLMVAVAVQMAGALTCAHTLPVVHRDLKPDNIMIDDEGAVVLIDFGIA
ncbi:protein kinase domain-containing protein, partial [Streptomyces sp. NRRL S-1896]|uniref:protein kinase domain-containing protein n=1 Tax=Streptomyces sp. NRRL S-1896 TaxID=1463893 RepID=UPI0004CDC471